jgi:hypothetical protein
MNPLPFEGSGFFILESKESEMLRATKNRFSFKGRLVAKHPLKLTALLYLREALLKEDYETCAQIVQIAKEFGAADFEVDYLLEDPRRSPT